MMVTNGIVNTRTINRNRRFGIPKGTRAVGVVTTYNWRDPMGILEAEKVNRKLVIKAYEKEFGEPVKWDNARISHNYLTMQVCTELLVFPNEWSGIG